MRKALVLVTVLLALFAAACGDDGGDDATASAEPTSQADTQPVDDAPQADCTDQTAEAAGAPIELQDFQFDPACVKMTSAQGLSLNNTGQARHNFSVEGFAGLDVDIEAGDTNNTEATGLDAGTYVFFCEYHRASGMEGQLQVVEG